MSDIVADSFAKLKDNLKGLRFGTASITLHVRSGRVSFVEVTRAETMSEKDAKDQTND